MVQDRSPAGAEGHGKPLGQRHRIESAQRVSGPGFNEVNARQRIQERGIGSLQGINVPLGIERVFDDDISLSVELFG